MSFTTGRQANNPDPGRLTDLLQSFAGGRRSTSDVARLSDLAQNLVPTVRSAWPVLPLDARRYVVRTMVDLAESDPKRNFNRVLQVAVGDPDPEVCAIAIPGLWEDESTEWLEQLLQAAAAERDPVVREAIAVALGRFAYLAETDAIDREVRTRVRETLLTFLGPGEPVSVRRRALESLAYFSDDASVDELIASAYVSPIHDLRVSAIFAMGRNLNSRWLSSILVEMNSDDPELRYEAARAAGEFGDSLSIDSLLTLIDDEDREVQLAAIGALGQIGDQSSVDVLRQLSQSNDAVVSDAAAEALTQTLSEADPLSPSI
jgi:HEAT repeat protein